MTNKNILNMKSLLTVIITDEVNSRWITPALFQLLEKSTLGPEEGPVRLRSSVFVEPTRTRWWYGAEVHGRFDAAYSWFRLVYYSFAFI